MRPVGDRGVVGRADKLRKRYRQTYGFSKPDEASIMQTLNQFFANKFGADCTLPSRTGRGIPARLTVLALCSALLLPGIAMAKKPVTTDAGCVVFPPAYVDTGYPFTLKIVRDPAYPGVWSQPRVNATAVFTGTDGGKITAAYSETSSRYGYGVTYVNATLLAPSCNGAPCAIDTSVDAVITAVVSVPLNKGNQFRETACAPVTTSVNPAQ
jgi:hypothetical protein